jgi:Icc-related predicted phosphoesterase
MKVICISDTHNLHKRIPTDWFPTGDVIIHAGDVSGRGSIPEIKEFLEWFSKLPYPHKILIAGNHDWGFQRYPEVIEEILKEFPNITYLQDSGIEINGVRFWGSPWQPTFYNWAFNLDRGPEIREKWKLIPEDTDVLITHGPAYGHCDMVLSGEFVGCEDLLNEIHTRLKIKWHICGHIHCGHGESVDAKAHYINASIVNERYEVQYKPIVFEIGE